MAWVLMDSFARNNVLCLAVVSSANLLVSWAGNLRCRAPAPSVCPLRPAFPPQSNCSCSVI